MSEEKKVVTHWAEASYWAMMTTEAIERKSLLEAQEDVKRLKERLEWVAIEEEVKEKNGRKRFG